LFHNMLKIKSSTFLVKMLRLHHYLMMMHFQGCSRQQTMIKSSRMWGLGHVPHAGEKINFYTKFWFENRKGRSKAVPVFN
jgi:hypothetical protein